MVKISDCSCECRDKRKERQIEERALSSINKILSTEGTPYYPDGTGAVTMPVAKAEDLINAAEVPAIKEELKQMKISDAETDEAVRVLEGVADNHAREIAALKSGSGDQSKEITAIEGRVSDVETQAEANATAITAIKAVDTQQTKDIASVTSRVTAVEGKAATNSADIAEIRTDDVTQNQQIAALQTLTNSITESLISDVEVSVGTDAGSFIVSVIEEDGTKRSSDNFQYGRVGTFELLQGAQAGYVKGRLTLVDGTVVTSNDFQILQIVESDVYVSSITLTPDYVNGELGGEIGYSNGNTAQINAVKVPTAPGVTSNINDLLSRMTAVETVNNMQNSDISGLKTRVATTETDISGLKTRMSAAESKNSAQDGEISALDQRVQAIEDTPGIGSFSNAKTGTILGSTVAGKVSANADGTGSVNGWSDKADVSALNNTNATVATKANQTALDATNAEVAKKADQADLAALQNRVMDCFNEVAYDPDANKITFTALDGQSNAITLQSVDIRIINETIPKETANYAALPESLKSLPIGNYTLIGTSLFKFSKVTGKECLVAAPTTLILRNTTNGLQIANYGSEVCDWAFGGINEYGDFSPGQGNYWCRIFVHYYSNRVQANAYYSQPSAPLPPSTEYDSYYIDIKLNGIVLPYTL